MDFLSESEENMNDILKCNFKISFIFSESEENMHDILKCNFKISFIFSSDSGPVLDFITMQK